VAIELERTVGVPEEVLEEIGARLFDVYRIAYSWSGDLAAVADRLRGLARAAWQRRGGDIGYKRLFVKSAVHLFHAARAGRLDAWDRDEGSGGALP
jgi:hypothetical protein